MFSSFLGVFLCSFHLVYCHFGISQQALPLEVKKLSLAQDLVSKFLNLGFENYAGRKGKAKV